MYLHFKAMHGSHSACTHVYTRHQQRFRGHTEKNRSLLSDQSKLRVHNQELQRFDGQGIEQTSHHLHRRTAIWSCSAHIGCSGPLDWICCGLHGCSSSQIWGIPHAGSVRVYDGHWTNCLLHRLLCTSSNAVSGRLDCGSHNRPAGGEKEIKVTVAGSDTITCMRHAQSAGDCMGLPF